MSRRCASGPPARRGRPTRRSRGAGWMAPRQDAARRGADACSRRGRVAAQAGAGARGTRGAGCCGRWGAAACGRRGGRGPRDACAGSVPGRAAPASSPARRRGGRTARAARPASVRESLGRGNQDRARVRRCAAGRAAVARTCVLAGPPRRSGRRPGRGTSEPQARVQGGRARRDDRNAAHVEAAAPSRTRVGARAGPAPFERPGTTGRRDVATDRAGRHGPRRRTRSRDAPEADRARHGRTLGGEVGGPGRTPSRRAGRRGTRDDSDPAGGHIRVQAAVRPLTPRDHVEVSGSAVRARRPPVVRASLPMRSPSPLQDLSLRRRATAHSPCSPDNRATSDGYLSAIRSSTFHQSTAITQTDQKNSDPFSIAAL
jgi:hypothetical protein